MDKSWGERGQACGEPGLRRVRPVENGGMCGNPDIHKGELLRFPGDFLWKTTVLAVENAEIHCGARDVEIYG